MAAHTEPEIILYDLACTKNECFSPIVWRIRLVLNYKRIPYKTIFLEFPDIEPTLKGFGLVLNESQSKFTVPAILHVPTNTYMMDSVPIAEFLESKYPDPPLYLTSELGQEIQEKSVAALSPAYRWSILPREINILSPRSQEYFRRAREAVLGHPLEDLLDPEKEESTWKKVFDSDAVAKATELMRTHEAEGPFVLGAQPSYADFRIAGSLQCARVIDEGVFQRTTKLPAYKRIYEACLPYMDRKN